MEIVTSFKTLMILAKAAADAERRGDPQEIEKAVREHDEYRDLCLQSDRMMLHCYYGDL
jgi:hypothetical protein